ncbi:acetyl-CoA sensor PanZ family protein [Marinospirillum perlucidum]|uniref:acetyl-CoA sensor PanZ family protein n=1 Tax=Marinospirillum perlucidum TaxID=1982602 RepID=UPI000DF442A6|nr:acetyl-CoA sensor PanZ family protein [Marinospirillum perlucidum]
MPVQMIRADAATLVQEPVWRTDLEKIYSEAEPSRRCLQGRELDAEIFINTALASADNWFAGALFNDHLVGAVLITVKDQQWQLRHLCVREVTRRRGVGSRLMTLVAAKAKEEGVLACVPDEGLTLADQVLVRRLGYTPAPEKGMFVFAPSC